MSVAKDLWLQLYEEARAEYDEAGMNPVEADELAGRYAERNLPDRLADRADHARMIAKEAYIK